MSSAGSKGRSLRTDRGGQDDRERDDQPAPIVPIPGGEPAPFARFGPGADSMTASAERNRSQSLGIFAIVGGVVFSASAALVVSLLVLLLFFGYRKMVASEIAKNGPTTDQHIRDSGVVDPIENVPGGGGRRGPGGKGGKDGGGVDIPLGPQPGPATVIVSKEMVFLSIEVNCPGGYRQRGTFRSETASTMKATVYNVPGDERCTVTFQGSEPAKTWISGNQTMSCTFNPVVCHMIR